MAENKRGDAVVKLSVCTVCSNPVTLDFPLKEVLLSSSEFADEIILINGDDTEPCSESGEVNNIVNYLPLDVKNKIRMYHLPWVNSFRKNMSAIAMSAAISQCKGEYVLWIDEDEIIHEENYNDIISKSVNGIDVTQKVKRLRPDIGLEDRAIMGVHNIIVWAIKENKLNVIEDFFKKINP